MLLRHQACCWVRRQLPPRMMATAGSIGVRCVVAMGDGLALVDEDFGDGVVEEDVEVEWRSFATVSSGVADANGVGDCCGALRRSRAAPWSIHEGLVEHGARWRVQGSGGSPARRGQTLDRCSGARPRFGVRQLRVRGHDSAPFAMERRRGRDIMPAQPAALYSACGRVS